MGSIICRYEVSSFAIVGLFGSGGGAPRLTPVDLLEIAMIAGSTRQFAGMCSVFVRMCCDGELNRIIRERTNIYVSLVPPDSPSALRDGYIADLRRLTRLGITSTATWSSARRLPVIAALSNGMSPRRAQRRLRTAADASSC